LEAAEAALRRERCDRSGLFDTMGRSPADRIADLQQQIVDDEKRLRVLLQA
jgi:hypothetical protein